MYKDAHTGTFTETGTLTEDELLAWIINTMRTETLADDALRTSGINPHKRHARFALYDRYAQYRGSFNDESSAHGYVAKVAPTPARIGGGYIVVKFR